MSNFELSPIKAMELAAAKIPNVISLAQGIPSFPTPLAIKEFVKERISQGACDKYSLTLGLSELREEISLSLKKEGLSYDPETEILATAGSIEGITASLLSLTSPGDEVILPSPSYVSYQGAIAIARCKPVFAALDEDNNFDFDVSAMERAISPRTRVILYCSPNNPSGTLFSEEKTRGILALAEKHNLTIVVDEVYKDFYYEDLPHFSATHLPDSRPRLIRVCSFSKAFAMTGWRIGFVHADKKLLAPLVKYHDAMVTCAPVVSQYAAIAALRFGEPYLADFRREYRKRRDYTIEVLDSLSHVLDYQLPKAAYFVFPRIKDTVPLARDSRRLAYDILEKVALAVVPGHAFGPSGESHLRISFGREKQELEEGLERLKNYFNNTGEKAFIRTSGQQRSSEPDSKLKIIGRKLLAACARSYLRKTKPVIIGIAGLRGKTVYKRYLTDLFSRGRQTRCSILSYNTAVGFPLSVLSIQRNAGQSRWALALKAVAQALVPKDRCEFLVLEYGIFGEADARELLSIAKPDYLVLSEIEGGDPQHIQAASRGINLLSDSIPSERIVWSKDDTHQQAFTLEPSLSMCLENVSDEEIKAALMGALESGKHVGQSARSALIASIIIGLNCGLAKKSILEFLHSPA